MRKSMKMLSANKTTNMGTNCKMWAPLDDATPFTDLVDGGITFTDASAVYTNKFAPGIAISPGTFVSVGAGALDAIPAAKHPVVILGYKSDATFGAAFANFSLGTSAVGTRLSYGAGAFSAEDDDGDSITFTNHTPVAANGDNVFVAYLLNRSNGLAYTYEAVSGAAASLKDAKPHQVDGVITLDRTGVLGNTVGRIKAYGWAIFEFTTVPDDFTTALDFIADRWARGIKVLPPSWTDLA